MKIRIHKLNEHRYLELSSVKEFCEYRAGGDPIWIDITQPDKASLEELFSPIQLHPLILEASLEPSSGSRIAPYKNALFIKLPVQVSPNRDKQSFLSIICLTNAIVTIHTPHIPVLESIAKEFTSAVRFHTVSTSAILYQIIDRLIDEDMADALEIRHEIESLEESFGGDVDFEQVLILKRGLAHLSITFEEQHHCVTELQTVESELFDISDFREYFHDTLANLEYAIRSVSHQQSHLSELHQHYMIALQDGTNKRLRLLTIFSTVFMPLFLIAGIYGMNFTYMPELKWHYGYPLVTVVMLTIAGGLLWIFYRRGWFK